MGHSYIYLFKQDKLFRLRASGGNIPLGIQENVSPQCDKFILAPGDLFIMITDGIVEQTNSKGEEFGEKRLYKIIKNNKNLDVSKLKDKLLEEITSFRAPQTQNDDITAVFLSYNGISPTSSK
jgi:sigma-B regulation protein RsbU (phosphoserine phosphatase)